MDFSILVNHITQDADEDNGEEELKETGKPCEGLCDTTCDSHFEVCEGAKLWSSFGDCRWYLI